MLKRAGQRMQAEPEKSFVFLGGNLALELVNTEKMERGKKQDLLINSQDAVLWWSLAKKEYPDIVQEQENEEWNEKKVTALRALRKDLRELFETLATRGQLYEHHLQGLNTILHEGYYKLKLSLDGPISAVYQARQDSECSVLLPIVRAAMSLITEHDLSRLHICQNDRCVLIFYDTTRSATRHWCSVACTNRARSIKHYKQKKL